MPGNVFDEAGFEDWVKWAFDHPVAEPEWYQDENAERWSVSPVVILEYLTELFEDAPKHLAVFSDAQAGQGLWFLASSIFYEGLECLYSEGVLRSQRQRCVKSIYTLFEKYFAVHCSKKDLPRADGTEENPFDVTCFMWWDFVHHFADNPQGRVGADMDSDMLSTMERILKLNSDTCRRSALHGLGHWLAYCPVEATAIIDRFLQENPDVNSELYKYALKARDGLV